MPPQWLDLALEVIAPNRAESKKRNIPPLDGSLLPNDILEDSPTLPEPGFEDPVDALPLRGGGVAVAAGNQVILCSEQDERPREVLLDAPGPVGPLAEDAEGNLYVAVSGIGVMRRLAGGGVEEFLTTVSGRTLACPTGITVSPAGSVFVTEGSQKHSAHEWVWDLMEHGRTGAVWVREPDGQVRSVASGLSYPNGITLVEGDEELLVTTAWDHSVRRISVDGSGSPMPVLTNLPGYPASITAGSDGTFWVALLSLRTQLLEFVLAEDAYRQRLMSEVDPAYWVRPSLRPINSGLEPLQGGAIKKLGETKPWAPPRSYGLVFNMTLSGTITRSMHSRANGVRHGTWTARERGDNLYVTSVGAGTVVVVDLRGESS